MLLTDTKKEMVEGNSSSISPKAFLKAVENHSTGPSESSEEDLANNNGGSKMNEGNCNGDSPAILEEDSEDEEDVFESCEEDGDEDWEDEEDEEDEGSSPETDEEEEGESGEVIPDMLLFDSASEEESGVSYELLEAIPEEEEEDWASDSTLKEESDAAHAQPLSQVSTQPVPPSPPEKAVTLLGTAEQCSPEEDTNEPPINPLNQISQQPLPPKEFEERSESVEEKAEPASPTISEPLGLRDSNCDGGESDNSVSPPSSTLPKNTSTVEPPISEYFVLKLIAAEQQRELDLIDLSKLNEGESGGKELSKFIEASTAGSYFADNKEEEEEVLSLYSSVSGEMHQRLSSSCSEHQHLPPTAPREKPRSVLRKPGLGVKKSGRNVSFNESLNLFYEAECQCWIHEEEYARLRHEEQMQQQLIYEQATQLAQLHQHHHHHHHHPHPPFLPYEPPPLEFEDPPTLSPPEGYKDRFFPQMDPDLTRVSPPSPPQARRKVFLPNAPQNSQQMMQFQQQQSGGGGKHVLNGLDEEEDAQDGGSVKSKASRFGGILKGGRLWRSNSSETKKVSSPSEEPDVVKCTEKQDGPEFANHSNSISNTSQETQADLGQEQLSQELTGKVSIGTTPLRTSEQIRLAVDSTLRLARSKKNKQENSSLVEKLRWLTSLDDEDASDPSSGFNTWPSRDKNLPPGSKSDAGTSTADSEFVHPSHAMRHPISAQEAKIKQISYTLEDIDEGLKEGETELEMFITEDGGRMERIRRRYGGEDLGGDDYGFSRRPSVKGIKPKFSSTNHIFAQFTRPGAETPIPTQHPPPPSSSNPDSTYENMRGGNYEAPEGGMAAAGSAAGPNGGAPGTGARVNLNYDQMPNSQLVPARSSEESRSHFEMIRQSFEQGNFVSYNRPHSWSVSTLPHPSNGGGTVPLPGMATQQPQVVMVNGAGSRPNSMPMMPPGQQQQLYAQPIYGTVRRVPNVIGRPLFLHYGALSVEAHPNKLVQPYPPGGKVPETPSPTQPPQQPQQSQPQQQQQQQQQQAAPPPMNNIKYYGPPIRYYNPPPPVPPRSATTTIASGGVNPTGVECMERGNPEGATDEEPSIKEPYSMKV